ncbi:hypothetical protein M405DRAFT_919154 [Rhizopogon salebrosus TDB-379]|nr:hypothetical protein M405DRAFT_919154 [Rhizopogon salebrosus TDB-379]
MTSPLHIETVNAATKVVQYVRIGRASEEGLDQIALAGNVLTAISAFFRAMRGNTPAKVPGILLSCAIKLKPLTQGKTITAAPNWMAIGHDDPAILAHPWAAAARAWADTADTSFDLPFMNQTPAVAGVSLPTGSQVPPLCRNFFHGILIDQNALMAWLDFNQPGNPRVKSMVIRQHGASLADSRVESSTHATSTENIHVSRAVAHGTSNRPRPSPRRMSTTLAAPAAPALVEVLMFGAISQRFPKTHLIILRRMILAKDVSRRSSNALRDLAGEPKVACWSSAKGRPTPARRTAQRAKSRARSRRVSSVMPKAEEDSPDLPGSPVMDTRLDSESPDIEPLPASPMSIVVDDEDESGMARPNTRARSAVSKRLKTPGPSRATSKALSRGPQVKLGAKGEMPSAIARPSQRKEASNDVDIEMSAPVTTKVDKGKGRLIEVDLATEQDQVPKKRKIENVSGKTSGPKSSLKKREITSAEPDKGSVTPLASRSMC